MLLYAPVWNALNAPEIATALGDMILAWSRAEHEQIVAFSIILTVPEHAGSRLYQKLPNFRSRTQALLTLVECYPEFDALKRHILKLSKLSKTRNGIVHGKIISGNGRKDVRLIDQNEPLDSPSRSRPIKAADISNHADAVRRCCDEMHGTIRGMGPYKDWIEARIREQKKARSQQDSSPED